MFNLLILFLVQMQPNGFAEDKAFELLFQVMKYLLPFTVGIMIFYVFCKVMFGSSTSGDETCSERILTALSCAEEANLTSQYTNCQYCQSRVPQSVSRCQNCGAALSNF